MVAFPPCKINLGLQIVNKRPDGYHNISTCFYPVPWCDILEAVKSKTFSFHLSGNVVPGNPSDNLCVKAYHLLERDFEVSPVKLHLHKVIPTGAGLGGGSSDAAHTLRLLNQVFELGISTDQMRMYAASLGSDCSFFIEDKPKIGTGRGEVLSDVRVDLSGKFMVIIKPDIHVSTADAYAGVTPRLPKEDVAEIVSRYPLKDWRYVLVNDFEESVFLKYPPIKKIKEALYQSGAIYSSMSGSGSSVFGIFNSPADLKDKFKDSQYWSGYL